MRAVKLYGDKRVVVSKDLRDNTHRFVIGPHLNKAGLKHWKIALLADRMTSRDASRTTHTSFNDHEVNRPIPVTWDKKESVQRLRRADFTPKKDEVVDHE